MHSCNLVEREFSLGCHGEKGCKKKLGVKNEPKGGGFKEHAKKRARNGSGARKIPAGFRDWIEICKMRTTASR